MDPKRQSRFGPSVQPQNSFTGLIDEETRGKLATIGQRVRKQVSDGHLTQGSFPSYQGSTTGSLDQELIRSQLQATQARPFKSTGALEQRLKRSRDAYDEDNDYGDTDADDDDDRVRLPSGSSSQYKTYFVPAGHKSSSLQSEDFEDATFLRPRP